MKIHSDLLVDKFSLGGKEFSSRLLIGTGKFSSRSQMVDAVRHSQAEIVTMALRRVDLSNPADDFIGALDWDTIVFLPNTSGARTADEAVRLARLSRVRTPWVKLEVTPDPDNLMPDGYETLRAAETLVKEGFIVLPYIHADPILAKKLESVGVAAIMPLGAPIGSNLGVETRAFLQLIIAGSTIPVIVDAGLGRPSHAAEAMELGADAVLVNTAIAIARNPSSMAAGFQLAVQAGRLAYRAGLGHQTGIASASSPLTGFLRNDS